MKILRKTELKLFVTFFIIYTLFVHYVGWNEESRIALAKAIASEGRFEIDNYANLTGDRAPYNDHYYSDRMPGTSFLSVPIYPLSKQISGNVASRSVDKIYVPQEQFNATVYYLLDMPMEDSMMQILSIVFLSALPGALLVVLIYKISAFFVKQLNLRLLISFIFGLATPIFPYSIVMMGVTLLALFSFLAFYILIKIERKELDQKYLYISGLLLGFSIVIDVIGLLAFLGVILLFFFSNLPKKLIVPLFLGAFLGVLPLLIHNFIIFSNPLKFTFAYLDPDVFGPTAISYKTLNRFMISPLLALFFPYRGLFFYAPVLLLCFYGFFYLYKEERNLTKALLFTFALSVIIISPHWVGGTSFGQRHLTFIIPLLSLPFAVCLKKCWASTHFKIVLIVLIFISTLYNFSGLGPWECNIYALYSKPGEGKNTTEIAKLFGPPFQIFSLEFDLNPLYRHYLPLFLKNGPRSKIFESLLYDPYKVDIRNFNPIQVRELKLFTLPPLGILVLKLPFLVIPVLLSIVTLIWRKELFAFKLKNLNIGILLSILIILMFVSRFGFTQVVYDKNWYPIYVNATHVIDEKWVADKASMFFFWPKDEQVDLFFKVGSFYKPREITLTINNFSSSHLVASFGDTLITPTVDLKKGENIIRFESLEECGVPASLIKESNDYRCLSVILREFSVAGLPEYNIIFGENWYPPEPYITWSYEDPTIIISSATKSKAKINLTLASYYKPREIGLYVNGILFDTIRIETSKMNIITKTIPLREGNNIVKFFSEEKCDIPAVLEESTDERCLSFGLVSINLISPYELFETGKDDLIFGPNWYGEEPDGRWMSENSSVFLFSESEKEAHLTLDLVSYYEERDIEIYLNRNLVYSDLVTPSRTEITTPEIKLFKGENLVEFKTSKKCQIPAEIEDVEDNRCLSFKFFNLELV